MTQRIKRTAMPDIIGTSASACPTPRLKGFKNGVDAPKATAKCTTISPTMESNPMETVSGTSTRIKGMVSS